MKIKYRGHTLKRKEVSDLWIRIATDYNGGMNMNTLLTRYKNPVTKKPYSRTHIYWILRQVATAPAKNL